MTRLWLSPHQSVDMAEPAGQGRRAAPGDDFWSHIATRDRSPDFAALSAYLPNPDPILKAQGKDVAVYRDLLVDAHVGGCVRRRKSAVKALERGWDRGKARSRVAKDFEDIFRDLDLDRLVSEILDAPLYGYQPLEVLWAKVGRYIVPEAVVGKPPEWFVFDPSSALRFRSRTAGLVGEELPPHKFLCPRQDPTYLNPYGTPDMAMVFWPQVFRKGGAKFWLRWTEKYGGHQVVGKLPRTATPKQRNELVDQLYQMVSDAVAVIPDDGSVELLEATGKGVTVDAYERLLLYWRGEISIALLGQNQTTESDSTRASATAGLEVTRDIRDGHAALAAATINELAGWVADLNFAGADRPVYSFWEQEEVDTLQAERDAKLYSAGARFSPAYFQRAYDFLAGEVTVDTVPDNTGAGTGAGTDTGSPSGTGTGTPAFAEPVTAPAAPGAQLTAALADRLADEAADPLRAWLAQVRQFAEQADSLDALRDRLLSAYGDLPGDALAEVFALAFSVADLSGRLAVQDEAGDA